MRFRDLVRGDIRFHTDVIGDQVLLRSDGSPAYNFAVVVDDGLMGVTHVVRGEDHISNTPRQILIYEALDLAPPQVRPCRDGAGARSHEAVEAARRDSVDEFREKGYLPEALLNYLALLSWSPGESQEIRADRGNGEAFSLSDVGHSASVFDEEKLAWVNRHYLKDADPSGWRPSDAISRARGIPLAADPREGCAYLASLVPLFNTSVDRLDQVPTAPAAAVRILAGGGARAAGDSSGGCSRARPQVIEALAEELRASHRGSSTSRSFGALADRVKQKTGQKGRALFHPIRIALTALAMVRNWICWCRR